MKGIQFVIDDTGKKKAVLIDLSEWGELWEDIYDVLVSQSRKDEPNSGLGGLKGRNGSGGDQGWLIIGFSLWPRPPRSFVPSHRILSIGWG